MKKYVRAVLDDFQSADRRSASQKNGPAGAGGRGQVAGTVHDELVGQQGEGDGFFGVRIDTKLSAGDQTESGQKLA